VFTYSSRPGTPSAAMPDQAPVHVARERNGVLRGLAAQKNLAFRKKFVGEALEVITLQAGDADSTEALSDNYVKVRLAGKHAPNHWIRAVVNSIDEDGLVAELDHSGTGVRSHSRTQAACFHHVIIS
jgi:threonylcarbamoyladenosine tRNA methylthiotransferase MtaB